MCVICCSVLCCLRPLGFICGGVLSGCVLCGMCVVCVVRKDCFLLDECAVHWLCLCEPCCFTVSCAFVCCAWLRVLCVQCV